MSSSSEQERPFYRRPGFIAGGLVASLVAGAILSNATHKTARPGESHRVKVDGVSLVLKAISEKDVADVKLIGQATRTGYEYSKAGKLRGILYDKGTKTTLQTAFAVRLGKCTTNYVVIDGTLRTVPEAVHVPVQGNEKLSYDQTSTLVDSRHELVTCETVSIEKPDFDETLYTNKSYSPFLLQHLNPAPTTLAYNIPPDQV